MPLRRSFAIWPRCAGSSRLTKSVVNESTRPAAPGRRSGRARVGRAVRPCASTSNSSFVSAFFAVRRRSSGRPGVASASRAVFRRGGVSRGLGRRTPAQHPNQTRPLAVDNVDRLRLRSPYSRYDFAAADTAWRRSPSCRRNVGQRLGGRGRRRPQNATNAAARMAYPIGSNDTPRYAANRIHRTSAHLRQLTTCTTGSVGGGLPRTAGSAASHSARAANVRNDSVASMARCAAPAERPPAAVGRRLQD